MLDCKGQRATLAAQMVKNPPTVQQTQVPSLGQEDPLEKEMATHSSILAWKSPWMEQPGGLKSMRSQRSRHDRVTDALTIKRRLLPVNAS